MGSAPKFDRPAVGMGWRNRAQASLHDPGLLMASGIKTLQARRTSQASKELDSADNCVTSG